MLEKIGLPSKPSLRGNTWVVDASHCQGCSSQFTFINRKHHCRRCGGIFCSSCTQLRMVLRGQGDSPVRICEPCKKLEEAARFEMRHGHKNRAGRGGPKFSSKDEDEVLNTILGSEEKDSLSSGNEFKILTGSQRSSSSASCSSVQEATTRDEGAILRSFSVGATDMASTTPDELRQQALDEKKRYKTLKAEGKSEEALRAFKKGKELERQAGALDLQLRKIRRKALSSISTNEISKTKEEPAESVKINKLSPQLSKDDDLSSELKKLGWSDLDLHDAADRKPVKVSLEGELSSLLGEVSMKTNTKKVANGPDKSEVIAIKRNALALKREGKLAEAKEELKRAKILEKQIEEQEFLIDADDSDDELSALIRSMDSDKQDLSSRNVPDVNFNFENLVGIADDLGVDNFDVTDEDMDDPDITAALESVGWTEDMDESNLDSSDSLGTNLKKYGHMKVPNEPTFASAEIKKPTHAAPKSKLMIQRELLALKKRALALRREGKADEADEELKKGKFLEQQLEEMDQSSKGKIAQVNSGNKNSNSEILDVGDDAADVTEQDMNDPSFTSLLNNLGWKDEESEHVEIQQKGNTHEITSDSSVAHVHSGKQPETSRKSKSEVQRELLGLKRKALALRRQGEADEAEKVLEMAKVLEAQLSQMEAPKHEVLAEVNELHNDKTYSSLNIAADNGAVGTPVKDLMSDQLRQKNPTEGLERKDQMIEKPEGKSKNQSSDELNHSQVMASTNNQSSPQKEILAHKKSALALKREGKLLEAKEELRQAKLLEKSLQDNIQKASTSFSSSEVSSSNITVTGQKEKSPVAAPKMSSRDRFKLQQESLSHKRQALKLRREGRTEEAEAEFELAKALEIQLEELNSSDLNKPSTNLAEPVDDVGIEDLLDPQLLSALKAIGIDDATNVSRVPEKPEVLKSGKIDNSVGERTQLEERIKAEKVQALTLKRSGKQPEALEALRRARMLEKKLASLAS